MRGKWTRRLIMATVVTTAFTIAFTGTAVATISVTATSWQRFYTQVGSGRCGDEKAILQVVDGGSWSEVAGQGRVRARTSDCTVAYAVGPGHLGTYEWLFAGDGTWCGATVWTNNANQVSEISADVFRDVYTGSCREMVGNSMQAVSTARIYRPAYSDYYQSSFYSRTPYLNF